MFLQFLVPAWTGIFGILPFFMIFYKNAKNDQIPRPGRY